MFETRIIEYATTTAPWTEPIIEQKEVYVETTTETKEIIWHRDHIESLITQKTNDIANLEFEINGLNAKLNEIITLSEKK